MNPPTGPRRALRVVLTRPSRLPISGKTAALLLTGCLVLSAILIPVAARLPRWIEFELVLAGWWIVWAVAITLILHRGCDVIDDHSAPQLRGKTEGIDPIGCVEGPFDVLEGGCGAVLAMILAVIGLWLAVELLIPAIAFAAYVTIRGMLAWAVNDRHECAGSWPRSVLWGALSAALFTTPLALLVWAAQRALG